MEEEGGGETVRDRGGDDPKDMAESSRHSRAETQELPELRQHAQGMHRFRSDKIPARGEELDTELTLT